MPNKLMKITAVTAKGHPIHSVTAQSIKDAYASLGEELLQAFPEYYTLWVDNGKKVIVSSLDDE